MKVLGCLHAHYSNIKYIEEGLNSYPIRFQHFVDPGLMIRATHEEAITPLQAKNKVMEQLSWIASCGVDAIVITCTNYIAFLDDEFSLDIPIIKIDESFFRIFAKYPSPKVLVFTNPATVSGTTERYHQYLKKANLPVEYDTKIINGAFDYVMNGQIAKHDGIVSNALKELSATFSSIAVAQLSMVQASAAVQGEILNPLKPLIMEILTQLNLPVEGNEVNGNTVDKNFYYCSKIREL